MNNGWLAWLAAEGDPSKTGGIGPGLTAFLIVVGLFVATYFLARSMLKQIKKVPPTFDTAESTAVPGTTEGGAPSAGAPSADPEPDDV